VPDDFNNWASAGCTGWSYEEVLPYFKKSENSDVLDAEPGYHGTGGPLRTRTLYPGNIHAELFVKAGGQAGYPITKDYNGSNMYGFAFSQVRSGHAPAAADRQGPRTS